MKLNWEINRTDISRLQSFFEASKDFPMVKERRLKNIERKGLDISKENFWVSSIMCLMTTQQRSSADSPISKFNRQSPHPFSLEICSAKSNLDKYVEQSLKKFGGIRRINKIASEVQFNFQYLKSTKWLLFDNIKAELTNNSDKALERKYSLEVADKLKGFGPKQSRNLLQHMGLTVYEIPLDSRVIKWFNDFGFPLTLSSTALQDNNYYNFVLDGIHKLCDQAEIKPCLLDAAIFSDYDSK